MRTILIISFLLITYSPKADAPPLVNIGETPTDILQRYGKPDESNRVLIGGLYCWEWIYFEPYMMIRFRLDRVIYFE
jgi:hypothetical protein